MKISFAILLLSTVLFSSCKKDEPTDQNNTALYSLPSKEGSYWVYEWYKVDSNGVETLTGQIDSLFVLGDTVLNGKTYVRYSNHSTAFGIESYQRDSSGYIVNQLGKILYAYTNFGEILSTYDEVLSNGSGGTNYWHMEFFMVNLKQTPIIVPAGTFYCISHRMKAVELTNAPLNSCGDLEYITDAYYAPGIGEIKSEASFYSTYIFNCERRYKKLKEYFIP